MVTCAPPFANSQRSALIVEGRRLLLVPKGEKVKRGTTPGGEGPYKGSGGARETGNIG
jgi:hypothetical protein